MRVEAGCVGTGYVDLNTPRVGGGGAQVRLLACSNELVTDLPFARTSATATPAECEERIRTQPVPPPVAAVKDLTVCFRTSKSDAAREGETQKIVRMTLTGSGTTGSRKVWTLTVDAWNIP